MNERIKKLIEQATINIGDQYHPIDFFHKEKFAELIVQECADYIRETYDHPDAEPLAWTMEIEFGLHGDYA